MGVMLTANLIQCEVKTPTSGLILPLLDKLLKHFERKEGNSVFIISLKMQLDKIVSSVTEILIC